MSPENVGNSLAFLILVLAIWMMWPMVIGAVFVSTPMNKVNKMLEMAEVGKEDHLIDLGSGDGRIVIEAARKYGASSVGIEADPIRVFWSRLRVMSNGLDGKVEIVWGNLFNSDLSKASVVTIYQGQGINNRLKAKFEKELESGARIVSYSFTFEGWEPVKNDPILDLYLYILE